MAELAFNLFVMIGLGVLYVSSWSIAGRRVSTDHFGPQGFPQLLIVLSLALLAYLSVQAVRQLRRRGRPAQAVDRTSPGGPIVLCLLTIGAYVAVLDLAGYLLSTLLFFFVMGTVLGYTRYLRLALFALLVTTVLVVVFGTMFAVPLPRGVGWLRELSFLVY